MALFSFNKDHSNGNGKGNGSAVAGEILPGGPGIAPPPLPQQPAQAGGMTAGLWLAAYPRSYRTCIISPCMIGTGEKVTFW